MANVKKCDWCGNIGRIRFTLNQPGVSAYNESELCSAACVTALAQEMEVGIVEQERQVNTILGRIKRWL